MKEEQDIFASQCHVQRLSFAFCFVNKYDAEQDSEEYPWDRKGGLIVKIWNELGLNPRYRLRYILEDVINCQNAGTKYTGETRLISDSQSGPKVIITTDLTEGT
jgi:hypothetical protein